MLHLKKTVQCVFGTFCSPFRGQRAHAWPEQKPPARPLVRRPFTFSQSDHAADNTTRPMAGDLWCHDVMDFIHYAELPCDPYII